MAEESKKAFDPDATVAQPNKADAGADPDATVAQPLKFDDPEATFTQPVKLADPEATVTGPILKADPEATDRIPVFDPDATDRRPVFDAETTLRRASARGKLRPNPFAPKSPPETIQANLSSLGGVNPLVAMANPILAAVPQIRRTLRHPDPAALMANLRDQIESLELNAVSGEIADDTLSAAVYALCALLDESAAATPWGQKWIEHGLLQTLRGESGGAEGFFAQLDRISAESEKNADLLEFFYICLALGFEGRYRGTDADRLALQQVKDRLYELIARRRPRPDALSEHWRTPAAQAAADAALKTAERANAARAAAAAAAVARPAPQPAAVPSRYALSRWPRRAIWSAVAGIVGASLVLYMLGTRLQEDEIRDAIASLKPGSRLKTAGTTAAGAVPAVPAAPAARSALPALTAALAGLPVALGEDAKGITIALRDERQFGSGSTLPAEPVGALVLKVAAALNGLPGAILVIGHADSTPPREGTNAELSAARARAVARIMAKGLANPKRLATEGRSDAEPIAPNDTDAGRAKNRRVAIQLKTTP
jgi:type VI secretion system protein ImpK